MFKKLLLVFCGICLVMAVRAQSPLEDIVNDIKSDRISDIKKYIDNTVSITINNTQSAYSRSQAEIVLKDFFRKNSARDLVIENSGAPDNISKYAIGNFNAAAEKYNVYILLKLRENNSYLLQEIRINKE